MATTVEAATRALEPERRFLLPNVGWEGYEALLQVVGDRSSIRVTYDRGDVELMSPSYDHERFKRLLGRIVEMVADAFGIPYVAAGSTTWRRKIADRGIEPDDCFYIASLPRIRGKTPDLSNDPPPDLAIEIAISHGSLDRMGVYAALGVPEVWLFDGETLTVDLLQADGTYARVEASPSLPMLPLEEVATWLKSPLALEDQREWGERFRRWVRETLVAGEGRG